MTCFPLVGGCVSEPNRSGILTLRQCFDLLPQFRCSHAQIVLRLKIHPEFRSVAKPVGQAKSRITRYRPLSIDNLTEPVGGNHKLSGQLGWRYANTLKFLI